MRMRCLGILMVLGVTTMSACQAPEPPAPAASQAPLSTTTVSTAIATTPTVMPSPTNSPVPPATVPPSWKEFSSDRYGFAFRYPEACGVSELDGSFYVGGRIELAVLDAEGLSLTDYVNRFMAERAKSEDWQIENTKSGSLGGQPATTIDYRFGGQKRFGTATFTLKDRKVYVWALTAGGFACNEPDIYDQVVSSFRFTR